MVWWLCLLGFCFVLKGKENLWLCVFNYLDYIYLFVNFFRQYIWIIFFHLSYTLVYSPTPPYVPSFMFFVPSMEH